MSRAAIIGAGVIGGGWAARFLLNGWDVAVWDPDPQAERKLGEVLDNARRSLPALYDKALPGEGRLSFRADLAAAVADADWVQESAPERLPLKRELLRAVCQSAPDAAVIGSSTSGFRPSQLTAGGDRVIVAHPFNPVYLLPLVELVGETARTGAAAERLRAIGMYPLILRKEIDAHIADRLLESIWREALWLVNDGVASTADIDEAIRMGFGLRWAQMGLFETYRIAGGEAGMRHFLAQFGPALQWPWTRLTEVPELTEQLVERIAQQSDAQSGHHSVRALERLRDDNLVAILRALRRTGGGAGPVIDTHETNLADADERELPVTVDRQVPQAWTDYNGHVNEAHYLEAAAQASDRFMALIGADAAYIEAGASYFTAETHLRFLDELEAGERLWITTQVLLAEGRKMQLFHRLHRGDGGLAATVETLLLHVDLKTRRSTPPAAAVADRLADYARRHADLAWPEGAGRRVGQARERAATA